MSLQCSDVPEGRARAGMRARGERAYAVQTWLGIVCARAGEQVGHPLGVRARSCGVLAVQLGCTRTRGSKRTRRAQGMRAQGDCRRAGRCARGVRARSSAVLTCRTGARTKGTGASWSARAFLLRSYMHGGRVWCEHGWVCVCARGARACSAGLALQCCSAHMPKKCACKGTASVQCRYGLGLCARGQCARAVLQFSHAGRFGTRAFLRCSLR